MKMMMIIMIKDYKDYFPATPLTRKREIPQESGFHFEVIIYLCVSLSLPSVEGLPSTVEMTEVVA